MTDTHARKPGTGRWRMMDQQDLKRVFDLSADIHKGYPESSAVFREKLSLFGMGCFVLCDQGGLVQGYCLSHPWSRGTAPRLNALLEKIPIDPDIYFIHDIALARSARRLGYGDRILHVICDLCRLMRIPGIELISVSSTEKFWARRGFMRTEDAELQSKVKAAYASEAVPMYRPLEIFLPGAGL